jgi:2-oxo-4-hydroxy-4-carboxy-5-ureidoimidazoline decarboxylase
MILISTINGMSEETFVQNFGDVAEHSPWVARGAMLQRPFKDREAMISAFEQALDKAVKTAQLLLIRMHPDLATRAKLSPRSRREQQGAGLDTLDEREFNHFTALNTAYKAKFGFPFIFAVKGATKEQVLASFEARLGNSAEAEFAMAMEQIKRIFRFRLEDRVAP